MDIEVWRCGLEVDREHALVRAFGRLGAKAITVDQDARVLEHRRCERVTVDLEASEAPVTFERAQLLDVSREHGPARKAALARDHGLRVGEAKLRRAQRGRLHVASGWQMLDERARGGGVAEVRATANDEMWEVS